MRIEPMSKDIYDLCVKNKISEVELAFSGGSDVGFLTVMLKPADLDDEGDLKEVIENWAWDVYSYSGAGVGTEFGDNITYDLKENTMKHRSWHYEYVDKQEENLPLEVEDD